MLREQPWKMLRYVIFVIGYSFIIPLACLIPKANYVALISRFGNFEGNLKYLFLYLKELKGENYEFVFLTDKEEVYSKLLNHGFKVWFYPNFVTIFRLLRTRVIIVDGNEWTRKFMFFFLFKSKKVQIWHATGLKAIGLLRPVIKEMSDFRKVFKKENTFYDFLVLSSEYQVIKRSAAFRYGYLLINGLPRNDVFFKRSLVTDNNPGCDTIAMKKALYFKKDGYKLIVYAPTWRKNNYNSDQFDLSILEDFAQRYRLILIIKLHPKNKFKLNLDKFVHIIEYNQYADVYPLLTSTDLLITDYSSIYLDYLLTDKPIIFYPYDSSDYIGKERELLIDYEKNTPGPKCYSPKELVQEIYHHLVEGRDDFKAERDVLCKLFFYYRDGKSSERLWNTVKESILFS